MLVDFDMGHWLALRIDERLQCRLYYSGIVYNEDPSRLLQTIPLATLRRTNSNGQGRLALMLQRPAIQHSISEYQVMKPQ